MTRRRTVTAGIIVVMLLAGGGLALRSAGGPHPAVQVAIDYQRAELANDFDRAARLSAGPHQDSMRRITSSDFADSDRPAYELTEVCVATVEESERDAAVRVLLAYQTHVDDRPPPAGCKPAAIYLWETEEGWRVYGVRSDGPVEAAVERALADKYGSGFPPLPGE